MKRTIILSLLIILAVLLSGCISSEVTATEPDPDIAEGQAEVTEEPAVPTATPEPIVAPIKGGIAPDFELESTEGKLVSLSDYAGVPLVLNFWATWCPPCVQEMPVLQSVRADGSVFEVLAINNKEPFFQVRDFAVEYGLEYPVLLDQGDNVRALYEITSFPTNIFIDADGIIRVIHVGAMTEDMLKEFLLEIGITE